MIAIGIFANFYYKWFLVCSAHLAQKAEWGRINFFLTFQKYLKALVHGPIR